MLYLQGRDLDSIAATKNKLLKWLIQKTSLAAGFFL
tara:strand:- start:17 stop:124 length:108 start_codon:yes stop_codon:yes gene_type:complete